MCLYVCVFPPSYSFLLISFHVFNPCVSPPAHPPTPRLCRAWACPCTGGFAWPRRRRCSPCRRPPSVRAAAPLHQQRAGWGGRWGGVVVGPFQPEWIFHTINYGRAGICVSGLLASRAHAHVHRPISRRKQTQQDI